MSEVGRRPRRTGRRSRRRLVEMDLSDSDVENTDPSGMNNNDEGCIDLTEDDDIIIEHQFVDLTSPIQENRIPTNEMEPVIITGVTTTTNQGRRRRGRNVATDLWDSDSEELPDLELPGTSLSPETTTSGTNNASLLSPEGNPLSCPICMDSINRIRASGRQLHSTICGHIFCNECLKSSLQAQKRCPTCRKKLTQKQTHPIFL